MTEAPEKFKPKCSHQRLSEIQNIMGTSELSFRGKSFGASDSILEVLLRVVVDEFDKLDARPDWLKEMRDDWYTQATQEFGFGIVLELDRYLSPPGRRAIVLQVAERTLAKLKSLPEQVPPATLNTLGAGESKSPFTRDVPAEVFVDLAWEFVDLLDAEDALDPRRSPIATREALLEAIDAHRNWLNDSATGKRLILSDTKLSGADLRGLDLSRVRLSRVDLKGAKLARLKLSKSDLEQVDFEGADLGEADFGSMKVRKCNFNRCSAESATFAQTLIDDCSFESARLDGARFDICTFRNASMADAAVRNTRFVGCTLGGDLRRCDFDGSEFVEVRFRNADLRGASFLQTTLRKTTLREARFHGVHGLPFLVDALGGGKVDFSPNGDSGAEAGVGQLRQELGGGSGTGPWGEATFAAQYAALRVDEGTSHYFSVERRADRREVIRVVSLTVEGAALAIQYDILDKRLVDSVVHDLIFGVVLGELFHHELRAKVDQIEFKNVLTGTESSRKYQ